jgi:hypothetical protein
LKTKFMLGAIVVAVLAVFGVIGLQQSKTTEAANVTGFSGCVGSQVAVGYTCDLTVTFFDDWAGTNSNVAVTVTGGTLGQVSTTCVATVSITGGGTAAMTLALTRPRSALRRLPVLLAWLVA